MILYHGTYMDFGSIDLAASNPYKDFGKGFYLTDIKSQAEQMAQKKAKIFNGVPTIISYSFDERILHHSDLSVKIFQKPDKEWAEFIYNNRSRKSHFKHDFDIVIGPIANDGVAYLLSRFEEGIMTIDELARELQYRDLNQQYFFGTQKAIKLLERI